MLERGILDEDEPVELLEGDLVLMSPQSPRHSVTTEEIAGILQTVFGAGFFVLRHSSIKLSAESLPEPDVTVVRGAARDFRSRYAEPLDIALVVEISSSTRLKDRRKATLYARAGIACYWLVDLDQNRLEVRSGLRSEGEYGLVQILDPGERVQVPGTGQEVEVNDVLGL
ncbi:MAG TPA: Uma2 family endonuclease [Thermoanaerobaculia bacterium]|nr:Uma2 family endonuclease [Thermoanaerobaculia bacterium]